MLISDKIDFKAEYLLREIEGHFITINGSTYQKYSHLNCYKIEVPKKRASKEMN